MCYFGTFHTTEVLNGCTFSVISLLYKKKVFKEEKVVIRLCFPHPWHLCFWKSYSSMHSVHWSLTCCKECIIDLNSMWLAHTLPLNCFHGCLTGVSHAKPQTSTASLPCYTGKQSEKPFLQETTWSCAAFPHFSCLVSAAAALTKTRYTDR